MMWDKNNYYTNKDHYRVSVERLSKRSIAVDHANTVSADGASRSTVRPSFAIMEKHRSASLY
jgi:hypothetical protein